MVLGYQSSRQGRCSAIRAVVFVTLLVLFETSHATTLIVGDAYGWNFNVGNWTNGKNFTAGDILVFNYDPSFRNVVAVDLNGYKSCTASATFVTYNSRKDQIKLSKGHHYFICSIPGHCSSGLKISLNAS